MAVRSIRTFVTRSDGDNEVFYDRYGVDVARYIRTPNTAGYMFSSTDDGVRCDGLRYKTGSDGQAKAKGRHDRDICTICLRQLEALNEVQIGAILTDEDRQAIEVMVKERMAR